LSPAQILLLLLWEHPFIYKQAKRPLDLPLTLPVIVLPDDLLSHQKPELILSLGMEDDHPRPEAKRQQVGDVSPAGEGTIRGAQQTSHCSVEDALPTKPTAC